MKRPPSNRSSSGSMITSSSAGATTKSALGRPGPTRRCLVGLLALLTAQLYLSYTSHYQDSSDGGRSSVPPLASSSTYGFLLAGGGDRYDRQTMSLSPSQHALVALLSDGINAATAAETESTTTFAGNNFNDDDDEDFDQDEEQGEGDGSAGPDDRVESSLVAADEDDADDAKITTTNSSSTNSSSSSGDVPLDLQSFPYNHTFPRWGDEGIDFRALLRFMEGLVDRRTTTLPADLKDFPDVFPEVIHVWGAMSAPPATWLERRLRWNRTIPKEELESVGTDGVHVSNELRKRTTRRQIRHRVVPVEKFLQRSWNFLAHHASNPAAKRRWPRLVRTMTISHPVNSTEVPGGFPIIVWHGDYRGCNRFNFDRNASIPLLTTCAHIKCHHALPFPTYRTIADSLSTAADWDALFRSEADLYPWNDKISKVVWRGGLTGPLDNFLSPRSRLGIFAKRHASHPLLDVGINHIPLRHYHPNSNRTIPSDLARRIHMKPSMSAANFSNYKAILDTDGNSWSSRFGRLLCTNSVIVKVEPHYVDYFYRHLRPWVHYVPVRHDLSNLLTVVEWVLDDANEERVRGIVTSAQTWCRRHMTYGAIVHDMLDVLDAYVSYLDRGDRDWSQLWKESAGRLWDPSSRFDMQKLSHRIPIIRTNFTANALKKLRANRTAIRSDEKLTGKNASLRATVFKLVWSLNETATKEGKKLVRRNKTTTASTTTGKKKNRTSTYKKKKKYNATNRKRHT